MSLSWSSSLKLEPLSNINPLSCFTFGASTYLIKCYVTYYFAYFYLSFTKTVICRARDFCLYPQCLEQCLAQGRHLINICWMNEWKVGFWYQTFSRPRYLSLFIQKLWKLILGCYLRKFLTSLCRDFCDPFFFLRGLLSQCSSLHAFYSLKVEYHILWSAA